MTASYNVYITKKMTCQILWNQDITHHMKQRLKLQTLFSPGGQVERRGGHLMWAQAFIYYPLLWSKDKGNEDDYPVTGKKQMNCSLTATWALHNTQLTFFDIFLINSYSGVFSHALSLLRKYVKEEILCLCSEHLWHEQLTQVKQRIYCSVLHQVVRTLQWKHGCK